MTYRVTELESKVDSKTDLNPAPLVMTCESYGLKMSVPYAAIQAEWCIRRVDEKDDINCSADDQKSQILLERSRVDVKCRLKIGQKLVGSGWTEVYGVDLGDIAHFECQTSLDGLALDHKSNSKKPVDMGIETDEPVHSSLKMYKIGS